MIINFFFFDKERELQYKASKERIRVAVDCGLVCRLPYNLLIELFHLNFD